MIASAVIVGLAFLVFGKQLKALIGNTSSKVSDVLNHALAEPTDPTAPASSASSASSVSK